MAVSDDTGPVYYQLRDLLEKPELLRPPPVVVPRLAWEGRVTLLAAPEKAGKSTLLGQACAALAEGAEFLGDPVEQGTVLWYALDEPLSDVVRRLGGYGAHDNIVISQERPSPPQLEAAIREHNARAVVADTLIEFVAGVVADLNQAAQWQPVLRFLRVVMQRTGAACVLVHHANKTTKGYRDSSQIGAGVDAIIEMYEAEEDRAVRRFRTRGRMPMEDFRLRFIGERYELEEGALPLEVRVYRVIDSSPGIGMRQLRRAVTGKGAAIAATVAELIQAGAVRDEGGATGRAFHTTKLRAIWTGHARDTLRDTPPEELLSDDGQTGTRPGHATGHAPVSRSPNGGGGDTLEVGGYECTLCGTQLRQRTDSMWRCPKCCPDNRWKVG